MIISCSIDFDEPKNYHRLVHAFKACCRPLDHNNSTIKYYRDDGAVLSYNAMVGEIRYVIDAKQHWIDNSTKFEYLLNLFSAGADNELHDFEWMGVRAVGDKSSIEHFRECANNEQVFTKLMQVIDGAKTYALTRNVVDCHVLEEKRARVESMWEVSRDLLLQHVKSDEGIADKRAFGLFLMDIYKRICSFFNDSLSYYFYNTLMGEARAYYVLYFGEHLHFPKPSEVI